MINTSAAEEEEAIKIPLLSATYLYHLVVLAQSLIAVLSLPAAILLLLTASDCDNSFSYYLSVTENLSQDEMTF